MSEAPVPVDETASGFGAAVERSSSRRRLAPPPASYKDRSGPVIVDRLRAWGFTVGAPVVVADGDEFGLALREAWRASPISC